MLRRRLEMIETTMRRAPLGRAGWALVAVAALAVVPVRLVAKESGEPRCLDIGSRGDSAYIITDGHTHSMCGDTGDIAFADAQRRKGEDIVWFRVDGQDWVVRDPEVVKMARQYFAGVSKVGEEQAAIGAVQSKIGMEQSRIGFAQGTAGFAQAAAAQREAEIALQKASEDLARVGRSEGTGESSGDAVRAKRADRERQAAELKAELDKARALEDAGARKDDTAASMDQLGARMEALGREQSALGEKQRVLGEKLSRELEEAQRALSQLLERAMRDGTAERAM
jgi:hypothetical protein